MCGICGIWGDDDGETLLRMMRGMTHRGPDADGSMDFEGGQFGHRRLSIMDVAGGDQPLQTVDGRHTAVVNGEIYNYPEHYGKLSKDRAFRTKNDSEVIPHLYDEKGTAMVHELDGMFAFGLTDGTDLFLARDPLGIKPLYYTSDEKGNLYFASEMKSLPDKGNPFREFPTGSWYHSREGFHRYYTVPQPSYEEMDTDLCVQKVRNALDRAVHKRLMSDVPLGCFLSGGLDSSITSALASQYVQPLHTFATGYEGSKDLAKARMVADHIGSIHHEYIMTDDEILENMAGIIYYLESFEQATVRNAIPNYFTSKLASQYVTVVITGEGADELFGGYTCYKDIDDQRDLQEELRCSLQDFHNLNLQRADRATMAYSIEGRVPFLDEEMVALAQRVPPQLKIKGDPAMEKWVLRAACEDLLPHEIVWRTKEQFDEGSGIVDSVSRVVDKAMTDEEERRHRDRYPEVFLRSKEECYYHKLFTEVFPNHERMTDTVGRWSEDMDSRKRYRRGPAEAGVAA
ncbi:MAG: asparagine synthase B [Synergistales bacterium]|nr:asparagine synthase B [Synergistales bacterium]